MTLWAFGMEALMDGQMLVFQGEQLVTLHVREGCNYNAQYGHHESILDI